MSDLADYKELAQAIIMRASTTKCSKTAREYVELRDKFLVRRLKLCAADDLAKIQGAAEELNKLTELVRMLEEAGA